MLLPLSFPTLPLVFLCLPSAQVVRRHGIRVLIIHGAGDVLVPPANSRRLARMLPGAVLAEFDACGHVPQEEQPERFVQTVRDFVAAL